MTPIEHPCKMCADHYGDDGLCDRGMPVASPHRKPLVAPCDCVQIFPSLRDKAHHCADFSGLPREAPAVSGYDLDPPVASRFVILGTYKR